MKLRSLCATHPRRGAVTVVVAAFVLSRALAWLSGVRLDTGELGSFWHFIDPELLRERLFWSLFYLHGQPPGFNLFLGLGLGLTGGDGAAVFGPCFVLLGAATSICLLYMMIELGVEIRLATGIAVAWCLAPQAILYESLLLYTHPTMALLVGAGWLLLRAEQTGGRWLWRGAFALLAAVVLTRSLFHPIWLLFLVTGAVLTTRHPRRMVLLAGLAPVVLVAAVVFKNVVLFGTLSMSTWSGMSLARITTFQLPPETRHDLVGAGRLSALAEVRPFAPLAQYEGRVQLPAPTGEPLLDRAHKRSGAVNLHHLAYVDISRRYHADALAVITAEPSAYLRGVLRAGHRFLLPSTGYPPLARNRAALALLDSIYNSLAHFELPGLGAVGWMLIALPGSIIFGLCTGYRRWRLGEPAGLVLLFAGFTILWVSVASCLFEVGENYRFRFLVEPFILILASAALSGLGGNRMPRSRGSGGRDAWIDTEPVPDANERVDCIP